MDCPRCDHNDVDTVPLSPTREGYPGADIDNAAVAPEIQVRAR